MLLLIITREVYLHLIKYINACFFLTVCTWPNVLEFVFGQTDLILTPLPPPHLHVQCDALMAGSGSLYVQYVAVCRQ